jgi:phosphatidylinositol alpha-mannosyltransferase
MATGTPAIGSRISGIDQQIDDGRAGVLVEPGNVDGLAAALADLLGNPQKRHEMGERCRERAQRFSWESVTDQYIDIYRRLGT